ncbi:DUF2207 domain-containing protein [Flavobacterium sp. KACC 22763]|uniref:DUF2207 domain-containing protein n=1 Tax=Flavobacterium sp. KACC 22763 TaxID=3025668 RepID=UPI0023663AAB|nr:DUF2207 domain-containing protein [Flavobacterium sp. KACC 22763]WDF63379.1 DUF2207 domain-containing protein [Flavobacterium sp. KACC 22763]
MKKFRFLFSISILLFTFFQSYSQNDSIPEEAEKIKQFHADIVVKENGNLIVTETIKVYANGTQIQRGIFRELPIKSTSPKASQNNYYTVLSVTRNGFNEPYRASSGFEKFKIYIGDKKYPIAKGNHTYKITYEVEAQLHSYNDFDEVYWNVTGNYWDFEIDNVTAKLILPKSAKAFQTACYTGVLGSKAHECDSKIIDNTVYFTSKNLKKEEGFTIAAGFPKSIVNQPFFRPHYKMEEFLDADKIGFAIAVVFACFAFYYFSWKRYGKDPKLKSERRTIDLKSLYSPTSLQHILDQSINSQTLLVTIISLSLKGALEISDNGKETWADDFKYSLKIGNKTEGLSKEENAVLNTLFSEKDSFELDKETYKIFNEAKIALEKPLQKQYNLEDYHSINFKQMSIGFIITIGALLGYCQYSKGTIYWAVIFGFTMLVFTYLLLKGAVQTFVQKDYKSTAFCLFLSLFTGFLSSSWYLASNVDKSYSVLTLLVLFLIIIGFSIYLSLIGAYTELGLETKTEIEKLKEYLLNYKPEESSAISVYEENLPYAFALGIEDEWNLKFIDILKKLNYTNKWIKTDSSNYVSSPAFFMSFRTSYTTYSTSSSSGSSGGGSSGGGGGGGGGGGW